MKKIVTTVLVTGALFTSLSAFDFDIGFSGTDSGLDGFSFSIGDFYKVPRHEIVSVERSISKEDMSVVYFLAQRASRDANFITKMRIGGDSWWDISLRLGLNPETVYVVDTDKNYGPPYGKAYGYGKKSKKHRLDDNQISELVNVRFLSKYHGVSVDEIIERKRRGENYININNDYHEKRSKAKYKEHRGNKHGKKHEEKDKHEKKGHGKRVIN